MLRIYPKEMLNRISPKILDEFYDRARDEDEDEDDEDVEADNTDSRPSASVEPTESLI